MAVVIVNLHEPHHEVAGRLLELAAKKGYDVRSVVARRGEHDAALSFDVPEDVAKAFNADRDRRWPSKIENDAETTPASGSRPDKAKE
jgi:hypothetical protein